MYGYTNHENKPGTFEQYRAQADLFPGLLRIGVTNDYVYRSVADDNTTTFRDVEGVRLPEVATNGTLELFNTDVVTADARIALLPGVCFERCDTVPQLYDFPNELALETCEKGVSIDEIVDNFQVEGLLAKTGLPAFTVSTEYVVENVLEPQSQTLLLGDGRTFTIEIHNGANEFLDQFSIAQKDAFMKLALQTGYFDGLSKKEIELLLQSDEVEGLYCLDEKKDPVMYTLFSSIVKNPSLYPWFNPLNLNDFIQDTQRTTGGVVSQPITVTSTMSGIGVASAAAKYASYRIAKNNDKRSGRVLYNCNGHSIQFLPKFFTEAMQEAGITTTKHRVEALYYAVAV